MIRGLEQTLIPEEQRMNPDLDTLATRLYVTIDDLLDALRSRDWRGAFVGRRDAWSAAGLPSFSPVARPSQKLPPMNSSSRGS